MLTRHKPCYVSLLQSDWVYFVDIAAFRGHHASSSYPYSPWAISVAIIDHAGHFFWRPSQVHTFAYFLCSSFLFVCTTDRFTHLPAFCAVHSDMYVPLIGSHVCLLSVQFILTYMFHWCWTLLCVWMCWLCKWNNEIQGELVFIFFLTYWCDTFYGRNVIVSPIMKFGGRVYWNYCLHVPMAMCVFPSMCHDFVQTSPELLNLL